MLVLKNKAFTLIELIIVIAIIAFLAVAVFVAVNPAKRIGEAKDAIRASDVVAIEKAIEKAIVENYTVPASMATLTEDTPYMLVTEGGDDTGTHDCATLDESIARIDLIGEFKSYLGNDVPVDDDATGDDTGYYITRRANSFFIDSCYAYGDEYVDPCDSTPAIGTVCEGGTLYAGTGFTGLGSYKYMTTPGHCSGYVNNYTVFTPTCTGATDDLQYQWANNSGTTAYGVDTGATSRTDGASNTAILATNYTDTDAARYCENMIYGGYTDWYLPAENELHLVLYELYLVGYGNFATGGYWASTEIISSGAIKHNFPGSTYFNGEQVFYYVRCVRKY